MTQLTVLVVDDTAANLRLIQKLVEQAGHRVVTAQDGQEALRVFEATQPDLVLMDVMMPVMDGIAATRALRQHPLSASRYVPIVILSALDSMEDILRGLDAGADDYLAKPVNVPVLQVKLRNFARMIETQRELARQHAELETWRARAEQEVHLAAHVFARLTDRPGLHDPFVRLYALPASRVSGDVFCVARTPGGVLHALLADATGHGLPAAVAVLPVADVFYGMTSKGYSLAAIASELNRKLRQLLPPDRFVAATLVAVDGSQHLVHIWNGGNPDVLFIDDEGEVRRWRSVHPPLGILPDSEFCNQPETFALRAAGELVLCSDGVIEAEAKDGRFGLERLIQVARTAPRGKRFEAVVGSLEAYLCGGPPQDDASILFVELPLEAPSVHLAAVHPAAEVNISDWRFTLALGANELREVEVVPAVLDALTRLPALKPHQAALFVVVSELFNNALDHGVLGLDSAIKEAPDGFERYLQERMRRLAALEEGRVELEFHLHAANGKPVLDFRFTDSGNGFDHEAWLTGKAADHDQPHGRGIALVRSLCEELAYFGNGSTVRGRYRL